MYEAGDIAAKNFALTAKYYYAAANAGIPLAQYRLDALKLVSATGDITQIINFTVKCDVSQDFMAANGVDADSGSSETNLPSAGVAERAQFYAALIKCCK